MNKQENLFTITWQQQTRKNGKQQRKILFKHIHARAHWTKCISHTIFFFTFIIHIFQL